MHVDSRSTGFILTAGIRDFLRRKLEFALGRYGEVVRRVRVRLSDINGPKGGQDKACQLQVELAGQPALVVQDVDADLYTAIGRAARRADRQVARRVGRRPDRSSVRRLAFE